MLYILDQKEVIEENKSKKTISLNKETRIKEKDELETKAMNLENKRRKAKGIELYKNLEAYRKAEEKEEEEEEKAAANEPLNKIDVEGDTLLIETGNILADFIRLFDNRPASKVNDQKTARK